MVRTAQIAAKAGLKPLGRYLGSDAIPHRKHPHHALTGFLGRLTSIFKRWETVCWTLPRLNKVEANNQNCLMIAENLARAGQIKTRNRNDQTPAQSPHIKNRNINEKS